MSTIKLIGAIFFKDVLSELRVREVLPAAVCLGVLIAWVFRVAGATGSADAAAVSVLVGLLFSAVLVGAGSFSVEQTGGCMDALRLAAGDPGDIYIAKLAANVFLLCIFEAVMIPVVLVLFDVGIADRWLRLVVVLLLANICVSSIATLLGCAVQETKAGSGLLSVLIMAVLLPMMVPAVFSLLWLFAGGHSQPQTAAVMQWTGSFPRAVGFLAAFGAVFVTASWLLFGLVVER